MSGRGDGRFWTAISIMLFLAANAIAADITLSPSESCATSSCHSNLLHSTGAHDSGPGQQDCDECHVANDPRKHEFEYAASGAQLCNSCHAELTEHEYKHAPAKLGLCAFCHSAHESEYEGLLKFPSEALCVTCHNDIVPEGARTVHGPVEQGLCTSCHDAHSTDIDDHLLKEVPQLCFGCHNQDQTDHQGRTLPAVEETFIDKSLNQHPPFARGDCLLCHDPHASNNIRLQRRPYSDAFYTDFSSDKYFCLMCHGDTTFTEPRTLTATKFRNGNLNLHNRHVDRVKGRGCRTCHHQHASRLEAQIATDTYFGERNVGIKAFAKTETGGSCSPSCHRAVQYDRIDPVDNIFMVTPRRGVDANSAELKQAARHEDGETLFLQRCAGCHGADAEGKIGPAIKGATMEKVMAATDRVDLMSDLASLSPADLHAIVDSLPAGAPVVALPEGASDGMVLFATNCAGCHGPDAKGGIGPPVRGATRARIRHAIDEVSMMVAMKALDNDSIDLIGGYLGSIDVAATASTTTIVGAPDGKVIFSMNCIACHGADARGQIGPAIRGKSTREINEAIGTVPMMVGLTTLGDADRNAVGEYLTSLDGEDSLSAAIAPVSGKTFYGNNCAVCHGESASGHIGPDIKGHTTDEIKAAIERVPMMAAMKLSTEEQINAVGEYVHSLATTPAKALLPELPDGETLYQLNCAACHAADATGSIGPNITLASVEEINIAINQVPMMVAAKVLGAKDIRATADYLAKIRAVNTPHDDE